MREEGYSQWHNAKILHCCMRIAAATRRFKRIFRIVRLNRAGLFRRNGKQNPSVEKLVGLRHANTNKQTKEKQL
jgi:hypothetical protein